jgi:hypothetical protein
MQQLRLHICPHVQLLCLHTLRMQVRLRMQLCVSYLLLPTSYLLMRMRRWQPCSDTCPRGSISPWRRSGRV